MNTVTCAKCGETIEVDKALEGQIEARVLAEARHRHETEIADVKKRASELANEQLKSRLELEAEKSRQSLELEREKMKHELESQSRKKEQEQTLLIQTLREDARDEKEASSKLRADLSKLMEQLREERKARENAEIEAQKKLAAGEDKIREEVAKAADEKFHLRTLEQEKKLADMQRALEDAQRKALQGSQQNQGEVLELDLENRLREEFPFDGLDEVKKGQRGADIKQTVRNSAGQACGILLWETKNGKWQPAWVAKFKDDIRSANASIGVIVSHQLPPDYGDMKHLENSVWVVKPRLAPVLAVALRTTILQVDSANKMNANKDGKMEALYQFLVGPEFRHRVEAIVENYSLLQEEIEREKRAAQLRWSRQEKAIRSVIDNTLGMYGDLQGITSRALPPIRALEPEIEDVEDIQPDETGKQATLGY